MKRAKGGRRSLIDYLTKYVTKNEIEFYRLPWHCSRDISRLFTPINFKGNELEGKYFGKLPPYASEYSEIKEGNYYRSARFRFDPDEKIYADLDELNELIYNTQK